MAHLDVSTVNRVSTEPMDAMYADYLEPEAPVEVKPKKKKLTPAERMAKKLLEEQEFKKLEMRDLMRREYEMSKKTARKYHEHWESMCREVKLKEMRQDLEAWEEKINRVLKQKDEKIELILNEIATTEEIHKRSFSSQLQMMDYLMDFFKTFQDTSRLLYENEASEIMHDFYREVEERNDTVEKIKTNCENVAHATDLIAENEILSDYKIFLDKRDDRVNTEIEKRYRLKDAIIKKMKDLRKQLLDFLNSLLTASLDAQKYERINLLMERQRNFLTESLKLNNVEARCVRVYGEKQREYAQEEREGNRKLNDLKLEHAYFVQMHKKIENEIKTNRTKTYEKLKIITSESFQVLKKYQKLQKFGELLLSLAANCRKFQAESEKVLAWGDFQEPNPENEVDMEPFKLEAIELKDHVDISESELQNNAHLMRHFWRRQAIAEAQIVLLEEKKRLLLIDNQNYIESIKRLSKADNVDDLKETLQVSSALEKEHVFYC